jgi:ABC-type nitrate/sulfonate/bicarbonate transport system substrate-binding protein
MPDYEPIEVHGVYRSSSHLPIWELMEKAGIWGQVGVEAIHLEYCADPPDAEAALFEGTIDFISGNHLTPYALIAQGKPIVSLASPVNGVRDRLVSHLPVSSLIELRGLRIADQPLQSRTAGFRHPTGNHMLYLLHAGLRLEDVEWIELEANDEDVRQAQLDVLASGGADATFCSGGADEFRRRGFHVLQLDLLPMINGPTITSSLDRLKQDDRLGERLVKAMVLAIHFARTRREETELILEGLRRRQPRAANASYQSLLRMPPKPYPDPQGIVNAFELALMKDPGASTINPLALWDLHYLRELDQSGFIDALYEAPAP